MEYSNYENTNHSDHGRRAAFHNLGCKVNAYETEAMQQLLREAGYKIVDFTEPADVYVINTCSVTNMADRKSRQIIHRAKKHNPRAIVVATGCYVQTKNAEAELDASIDLILGNNQKGRLADCLEEFFSQDKAGDPWERSRIPDINNGKVPFEELSLSETGDHTRAFIKVQDGCNQFCSYCIIPYARGRVRSRNLNSAIAEIEGLAQKGYREFVLTGIHLSSYGVDTGESLLHLIRCVNNLPGVSRIRLGSLEPKIVTEDFARELSGLEKICPHFHLSLQSGCDATLKRMNRKYTAAEYEEGCRILRKYFTHPAITTDVIVGFPGETDQEFEETKNFLKKIHFYEMHIFKYSVRQGTRAAKMEEQIPEEIKTLRSNELIRLGETMSEEFRDYYPGTAQEVLFEEEQTVDGHKAYVGYTREYVRVACQSGENLVGQIRTGLVLPKTGSRNKTGEIYGFHL